MNRPAPATLRCFVALRPDAACAAQLDALARRLAPRQRGARPVERANLHLTLAFLGAFDEQRAPQVAARLGSLSPPRGAWRIDRAGGFAGARVTWAAGAADPALRDLAAQVRQALDDLHVGYDRKAFVPHVTLLRGAAMQGTEDLSPPIDWPLRPPELMVSARDGAGRLRYLPWQAEPA